ncbi:hypothetical protein EU545_02945, partial [Candidatus Thorarchaeota archaeon]
MPQKSVVCPACGLDVPPGAFCKFCGSPLPQTSDTQLIDKSEETGAVSSDSASSAELPEFSIELEGMDEGTKAILLARSELTVIDQDLDGLIEQIRATRQALSLEQADKTVLTARTKKLKRSLERTKARKKALLQVKGKIPLEKTTQDFTRYEDKLVKLDEIVDSLDPVVYKEQRKEIVDVIKQLKERLKIQLKESKKWLKKIESCRKDLQREISRLEAKFKIGDISDDQYTSSKPELKRTISVIDGSIVDLEEIIETAEEV